MEMIGYAAAVLALIAYLPQTIKTIKTRHTKSLSLPTFVIICASAILWTLYGFLLEDPAIWFTNIIIAACSFVLVVLKVQEKK